MLYVWDNGKTHEDWGLDFVLAPDGLPQADVIRFMEAHKRPSEKLPRVVLATDRFALIDPNFKVEPLADWASPFDFMHFQPWGGCDGPREEAWLAVSDAILSHLLAAWREKAGNGWWGWPMLVAEAERRLTALEAKV